MKEQSIYVDIGGGTKADFFLRQSVQNSNAQYIALDPTVRPVLDKPDNLHLIKWQIDDHCSLPFQEQSISGLYLNNVFDELRTDGHLLDWSDTEQIFDNGYHDSQEIQNHGRQKDLYAKILNSSKRVLRRDGKLVITEPYENIAEILALCLGQGFSVAEEPQRVTDPTKTLWTNWFNSIHAMLEPHEGKNDVAPTEFTVQIAA